MNHWLFKSEPDTWGWHDQLAKGDLGEEWGGVRNYQARNHMRAMAVGDRGFELARGSRRDLDPMAGSTRDLLEEVDVRRFRGGDRQGPADQEERKHPVLPGEVAGEQFDHGRIRDSRGIPDEGKSAAGGEPFGDGQANATGGASDQPNFFFRHV